MCTGSHLCLLSGDAHPQLTTEIAQHLGKPLSDVEVGTFADGESRVHIAADVRQATVAIVQPTSPPVNDRLMALALLADAATAAGAARVIGVVPYFGYSRQEQRSAVGEARSAQLVARLLGAAGIDHLITLDLHAPALESAFPMPATLLPADALFLPVLQEWKSPALTIVAPDAGGLKRAQRCARLLEADLAMVAKIRTGTDAATPLSVLGEVRGRECVIVDDMASTGRTLAGAADLLQRSGARAVHAVFTHPVMAEGALERMLAAPLQRVVTSDSIPPPRDPRIEVVSASRLLAEAIRAVTGAHAGPER